MAATALVDTGFLIALLDERDGHHRWATGIASRQPPPWTTCEAVLSEAFHPDAIVLHLCQSRNTMHRMKTLTVRLPEALVAQIEAESRERRLSKSDVVRERLSQAAADQRKRPASLEAIADLIGAAKGLPSDLSARKKQYLKAGYGRKRPR